VLESRAPPRAASIERSSPPARALPLAPEEDGRIVVVARGDSLWHLAGRHLDAAREWPRLYRANREAIADPDRIVPGMRLVVPGGARGR
jgi:nucleoid-associated protein YgaU